MDQVNPAAFADQSCRNEQIHNASSKAMLDQDAPALLRLQEESPSLKIFTLSSPFFLSLNTYFLLDLSPQPLAICRPSNEQEVTDIVRVAVSANISFTIRAGGHDSWGRSSVSGAIIIDMREMDSIKLSPDRKSVRIGGGTISGNLTEFLDHYGLVAVQGGCSSVGYTNWAACGGYGSMNGSFGLGCDQILGARVVGPNGEVEDASEEMLWGLRGGGCNFGVVTSLDVKVYSLPKILAGLVAFPVTEAKKVFLSYNKLLEQGLPDAFGGLMGLMVIPGLGTVLAMLFTWSSIDLETGRKYLEEIRSLGGPVLDTVKETTLGGWTEVGKAFSPTAIYTNIRTAYVKELSEPLIDLLIEYANKIPVGTKAMFIIHCFHGRGARPNSQSCFGIREPHIWLGIHGQSMEEGKRKEEAYAWSDEVVEDLKRKGLMMKGGYVALMGDDDDVPVKDCFGNNWDRLKDLKRKFDERSIFRHTIPSLC